MSEKKDYSKKAAKLMEQIDKRIFHARKNSVNTRLTYRKRLLKFTAFLPTKFGVQKFANISDKHVSAYVEQLKAEGAKPSTIKGHLSAIRYAHDMFDKTRHVLSGNEIHNIDNRDRIGTVKVWMDEEYQGMIEIAAFRNNDLVKDAIILARHLGLRLHETTRLSRNDLVQAMKTGEVTVKGKGGKIRSIPIDRAEVVEVFQRRIADTEVGEKVFVSSDEKTHTVMKAIQNFIYNHREKVLSEERRRGEGNLDKVITYHGLRHAYAKEQYDRFKAQGHTDYEARKAVSQLLGHERDEVTRIYIQ